MPLTWRCDQGGKPLELNMWGINLYTGVVLHRIAGLGHMLTLTDMCGSDMPWHTRPVCGDMLAI